jgi:hypothetical protein
MNGAPGIVTRLVEGWQLGGIFGWSSGAPLTLTASNSEITWTPVPPQVGIARTPNTPVILGDFPKSTGKVTTLANGATYFDGFRQVDDPSKSGITTLQNLQAAYGNRALADASGKIILASAAPGTVGTLGRTWIEGPGHIKLDVNL